MLCPSLCHAIAPQLPMPHRARVPGAVRSPPAVHARGPRRQLHPSNAGLRVLATAPPCSSARLLVARPCALRPSMTVGAGLLLQQIRWLQKLRTQQHLVGMPGCPSGTAPCQAAHGYCCMPAAPHATKASSLPATQKRTDQAVRRLCPSPARARGVLGHCIGVCPCRQSRRAAAHSATLPLLPS